MQRKVSASEADGRTAACSSIDREDWVSSKTGNVSRLTYTFRRVLQKSIWRVIL